MSLTKADRVNGIPVVFEAPLDDGVDPRGEPQQRVLHPGQSGMRGESLVCNVVCKTSVAATTTMMGKGVQYLPPSQCGSYIIIT